MRVEESAIEKIKRLVKILREQPFVSFENYYPCGIVSPKTYDRIVAREIPCPTCGKYIDEHPGLKEKTE